MHICMYIYVYTYIYIICIYIYTLFLFAMSHVLHGMLVSMCRCHIQPASGALYEDDIVYDELYIKTQKCRYQFPGAWWKLIVGRETFRATSMVRHDRWCQNSELITVVSLFLKINIRLKIVCLLDGWNMRYVCKAYIYIHFIRCFFVGIKTHVESTDSRTMFPYLF